MIHNDTHKLQRLLNRQIPSFRGAVTIGEPMQLGVRV